MYAILRFRDNGKRISNKCFENFRAVFDWRNRQIFACVYTIFDPLIEKNEKQVLNKRCW